MCIKHVDIINNVAWNIRNYRYVGDVSTPVPQILASRWRRLWTFSRTVAYSSRGFRSGSLYRRKGSLGGALVGPDNRGAPPRAAPPPCVVALWPPSADSRVFWKLPVKIGYW